VQASGYGLSCGAWAQAFRHLELLHGHARKRPEDLTAYERTLRAIDYLHRSTPEDLDRAQAMLLAAIAADPNYGAPHAWLARLARAAGLVKG
jgi:hypothetical protein